MDRSLDNPLPDISLVEPPLRKRIEIGYQAVLSQIDYFRKNFGLTQSSWKHDGTRVTEVDETISKELFDHLSTQFPLDDYCSEEAAEVEQPIPLNSEFAWVLDPVDGTNNYAVGIPECGISLGLLQNGVPVYGFIYDYGRDNLLQGGPKVGSFEGNRPVQATRELVNEKLTFCMHFPIPSAELESLKEVLQQWRIRCPGSAAMGLANVATGRLDGCLEYRAKPWDCAAGYPICEGAGARFFFLGAPAFPMTQFSPNMGSCPFRVGSDLFHKEICKALEITSSLA
jgi:myo-inositol-1(or 4)-monophosphatase